MARFVPAGSGKVDSGPEGDWRFSRNPVGKLFSHVLILTNVRIYFGFDMQKTCKYLRIYRCQKVSNKENYILCIFDMCLIRRILTLILILCQFFPG
jgi:hypothetical protein